MKKFTKILAMVLTAATFVFMSCNPISGGVVKDETGDLGPGEKLINFTADSDGLFEFSTSSETTSARTITPAAVNSGNFKFYLVYRDTVNSTTDSLSIAEITFNKDTAATDDPDKELKDKITKGSFTKAFTLSDYTFALYAVNSTVSEAITAENVSSYASFVGTANADLRYGDSVTFHMKANSKADGKGKISIGLSHEGSDGGWKIPAKYQVTVGLYNIDDDTIKFPTTVPKEIQPRSDTQSSFPTGYTFGTTDGDVPQGEYNLVVKYNYQPENETTTKVTYEYSEKVIVLMNQTSTGSIVIPEILEKAPDAPTGFVVQYQDPTDSSKNNYNVNFKWEDTSKNEREFILEILKLSETGYPVLPTNDDEWNSLATTGTKIPYNRLTFDAADNSVAGSLNKGNTTVTLSLPLEQRFVARICASNDAGQSAWAYVGWITTAETGWEKFADDVTTINRFRISYNLNGGTFTNADTTGTPLDENSTPALLYYASQYTNTSGDTPAASSDNNVILSPDGITEAKWVTNKKGALSENAGKIVLSKQSTNGKNVNFFKNWSVGSANGTSYETTVTYAEATSYIKNIKYYPSDVTKDTDTETKALARQPKDATDFTTATFTGVKIRQAKSALYTGFKNLSLVANYDTSQTFLVEIDDVSQYDLKPTYFSVAFKKDGTEVTGESFINHGSSTKASSITDLTLGAKDSDPAKKVLEVSVSKVNNITITANDKAKIPVTTYKPANNEIEITEGDYDKIHLVVKAIDGNTILVDQDWNDKKSWNVNFKTWKLGKYHCELTAVTNQMPNITYSYTFVIDITQ